MIVVINILVYKEVQLGIVDPCSCLFWISIEGRWLSQFQFLGFGWCCGGCGGSHSGCTELLVTHEERVPGSWYGAKWCLGFDVEE